MLFATFDMPSGILIFLPLISEMSFACLCCLEVHLLAKRFNSLSIVICFGYASRQSLL
uniref:Uncharacterized protein n=1 Tax=Rhizophora mucronata TaxID=61149 RepID=A0A2P2PDC8_RHIMU